MAPGELARTSKALNQLVEVRIAQSKLDEALDLARQSVRLTEIAAGRAGDDGMVQLAYGTSHFWLGEVHRRRAEIPAAVKQMQVYQAVTARLAARHPESETYQRERSYGHSVLASMLEAQGKLPEALEQHLATREVMQARLLARPHDAERQADLASTDNRIGFIHYRLGHLAEARRAFERELAAYRKLSASDPKNAKWQAREARSLSYMVGILESEGDLPAAIDHLRAELDIHSKLAARDPHNAQWQRFVTNSHVRYGTLLAASGDYSAARVELDKAEQLAATALSREEDLTARHSALASIALSRARMYMARGDHAAAATALATVPASLRARGRETEAVAAWVEADLLAGDLLAAHGDVAGARAHWKAADQRVTAAVAPGPHVLKLRAAALERLGETAAATQLIEQMYRSGYRHPDLIQLRNRIADRNVPATAPH
jgi:tetratricopeptide (TPR) repeat protein